MILDRRLPTAVTPIQDHQLAEGTVRQPERADLHHLITGEHAIGNHAESAISQRAGLKSDHPP